MYYQDAQFFICFVTINTSRLKSIQECHHHAVRMHCVNMHANTRSRWGNAVKFRMDVDWIRVVLSQLLLIVRAEWSFAIHYLNVVIKPICSNLEICLNYYFRSRNSVRLLRSQTVTESERCFFGSHFSVTLLRNLADFATQIHFDREKPEHANALIMLITLNDFMLELLRQHLKKLLYPEHILYGRTISNENRSCSWVNVNFRVPRCSIPKDMRQQGFLSQLMTAGSKWWTSYILMLNWCGQMLSQPVTKVINNQHYKIVKNMTFRNFKKV